jgi:hypothetical protein
MRTSPTRALIESFLVPLDAFPTKEVLGAVRPNELDHVIGDSIATLATFDCFVFRHVVFAIRISIIIKHHSGDSKMPR